MRALVLALLAAGCVSTADHRPSCVTLLPYTGGHVVAPGRETSGSLQKAQSLTICTRARGDVVRA